MNYLKGIDRGSNPNCILDGNKSFLKVDGEWKIYTKLFHVEST